VPSVAACNRLIHTLRLSICLDVGPHTTKKPAGAELISPTIIAARQAEKEAKERAIAPSLNDIDKYTKKSNAEAAAMPKPKPKPAAKLPEGCAKCVHTDCKKVYAMKDNHAEACKYHSGQAVFHDGAKYWSCCTENRKAYDWDTFMKIKKCRVGYHWDGTGEDPNK